MTVTGGMAQTAGTPAPVIRPKTSILDKSLSRGKQEVSLSAFALLFSETVQYCQVKLIVLNLILSLPVRHWFM